ncbi:MAG TPA: CHAT domain-containing tetratricopeptide repeat protein [Thermoanaerobaculia bacterium]|nr:CHAT domain-containing tetratricopeptide repeat protein [Thermoanaerobaculia bacterium]
MLAPAVGHAFERELPTGGRHGYRLDLAAGTFVELVVEQHGIDVVVELSGPDGERLIRVDSPTGGSGEERLRAVTADAGSHRLEVAAPWSHGETGTYALRVEMLRAAGVGDREQAAADHLYFEAERLREDGDERSLERALDLYQRAAAAASALGEGSREADAIRHTGWILRRDLDRKRQAIEPYRRAAALYAELGLGGEQAVSLNSLGRTFYELGETAAAERAYRRALELWRRGGDDSGEASALNNLAQIYRAHGDAQQALAFYDDAVARLRRLDRPRDETRVLTNRGQLYRALGRRHEALDDLGRALELARGAGARDDEAVALTAIGELRQESGDLPASRRALDEALALRRDLGQPRGVARVLRSLAAVDAELGRRDEAVRGLREALALFRDLEARRDEASVLVRLGWLLVDSRPREALATLDAGRAVYEALRQPDGVALAWLGAARAHRALGEPEAARTAAERGLDGVERWRLGVISPHLRASYLARQQDHYDFLVDLLMQLDQRQPGAGHDRAALAVSERSRARSLLESLAASGADLRRGADPRLLAREDDVLARLAALSLERQTTADEGAAAGRAAALDRELRRRLRQLDAVRAELRAASPRYAALTEPSPLTAAQIQQWVLDAETVLLEYDLGPQRSYLWWVEPGEVAGFALPPRAEIEALARRTHALLAASRGREAEGPARVALERLSETLLGPVAERLDGRRLLVVADGALHYLPFAALPSPAAPGEPLLADHEVVQMASASALAVLRRQGSARPPTTGSLAVLADPVFSPADPRLPDAVRRPAAADELARLVHTPREAAALRALVPAGRGLFALGFDADRELVTGGRLAGYRILHFATHGEHDAEHPELSRLVLSRFDPSGKRRDGVLHAHQVYPLDLPAELVVLSACDTALGTEVRGEGLVGLPQAFFYAGAERVLVSLWQVDDAATAELMSRFYRALLGDGHDAAAALRAAQLSIRHQRGWAAPYYWAGFVLQGEWRGPPAPGD